MALESSIRYCFIYHIIAKLKMKVCMEEKIHWSILIIPSKAETHSCGQRTSYCLYLEKCVRASSRLFEFLTCNIKRKINICDLLVMCFYCWLPSVVHIYAFSWATKQYPRISRIRVFISNPCHFRSILNGGGNNSYNNNNNGRKPNWCRSFIHLRTYLSFSFASPGQICWVTGVGLHTANRSIDSEVNDTQGRRNPNTS